MQEISERALEELIYVFRRKLNITQCPLRYGVKQQEANALYQELAACGMQEYVGWVTEKVLVRDGTTQRVCEVVKMVIVPAVFASLLLWVIQR